MEINLPNTALAIKEKDCNIDLCRFAALPLCRFAALPLCRKWDHQGYLIEKKTKKLGGNINFTGEKR